MQRSCADVNSPYKRKCWTNSGGPLVNSLLWGLHARWTAWVFSLQKALPRNFLPVPRAFNYCSLEKFILCVICRFSSYGHHLRHTEGLFRRLPVPETKEFQNGDRGSPGIHRIFIIDTYVDTWMVVSSPPVRRVAETSRRSRWGSPRSSWWSAGMMQWRSPQLVGLPR